MAAPAPRRRAPSATVRRRRPRDERLSLRATSDEIAAIRAAAEEKGVTVTDFVIDNAVIEAQRVLADRVHFVWPVEAYEKFLEILDRPARVDPRLREFLSTPSILEE
jgi:uncharacterized protein (DUF1778 family)